MKKLPLEQYMEKGNIGSWTDVYSLCATIYCCVTGKEVPDALDRLYEDTLTNSVKTYGQKHASFFKEFVMMIGYGNDT